ncbi:hypothetical protein DPMN_117817 [Dreissena polymorpha]|uniref:Uncharacterized protein n=1 Tax=Dreissena polymorpha TaxID=45954 RepID=A0A9D4JMY7_DREPO|nr:hypothetical protein DPMN_117817 [Dreissena polymorpha]
MQEGFICDMIINGIGDKRTSEKLMEIPADQLTKERVIETCRHVELTSADMKTLGVETANVNLTRQQYQERDKKPGYRNNFPVCNKCQGHHHPRNCPEYNKVCDTCGHEGHFKAPKFCKENVRAQSCHFRGRTRGCGWGRRPRRGKSYYHNLHYADDNVARDADNITNIFKNALR